MFYLFKTLFIYSYIFSLIPTSRFHCTGRLFWGITAAAAEAAAALKVVTGASSAFLFIVENNSTKSGLFDVLTNQVMANEKQT